MKIGSTIVTFNPNIIRLRQALDAVSTQASMVRIVDNGSLNVNDIQNLIKDYANVDIKKLNRNFGIAKAQNVGFQSFKILSYDWVLTLDQDTIIPLDYVARLNRMLHLTNAGIITGAYIDVKWNEAEVQEARANRFPKVQRVTEEISSGNLVLVQAWQEVGGFDERLFIDYVDFDFDYKLAEHGYSVYRINDVEFSHEIGAPVTKGFLSKLLLLNEHEVFDHSAFRIFYIFRNRLIVRRRHPQSGSPVRMLIREILNLREILIMRKPRFAKLRAALRGILRGVLESK